MAHRLKTCSYEAQCRVKVSDFTDFPWDRAFIFYQASKEEREHLLGMTDPHYQEDHIQLVFLNKNQLAYEEDEGLFISDIPENALIAGDDKATPPPIYESFSSPDEFLAYPEGLKARYSRLIPVHEK